MVISSWSNITFWRIISTQNKINTTRNAADAKLYVLGQENTIFRNIKLLFYLILLAKLHCLLHYLFIILLHI